MRPVPRGDRTAVMAAIGGIDIALWDLKGKLLRQPIYKLLGGAWRTARPFYASIGGNGDRSLDEVLRVVNIPVGVGTFGWEDARRAVEQGAALVAIGHPVISAEDPLAALKDYVRRVRG